VLGVHTLRQLIAILRDEPVPDETPHSLAAAVTGPVPIGHVLGRSGDSMRPDLADVAGQAEARRALELCAAGGHHLFLAGPPGAGKTMLAERLPGLLPRLRGSAALEATAIHSVAGTLSAEGPLMTVPPFCAPHHSASMAAMVGGGSGTVRPGAVSLAHRGVLFLDEAPEFPVKVLDALRQPLEAGEVTIARAVGTICFPARFQLVLAGNPCPCGRFVGRGTDCTCSPTMRRHYLGRLSGPLLDRLDVRVEVGAVSRAELLDGLATAEDSDTVAERVRLARERTARRLAGTPWEVNAEVPGRELRTCWRPHPDALALAERDMERGRLSARGLDRVLRVAWTVADLAGRDRPVRGDVGMALALRAGTGPKLSTG
jgi:magnesium chelatase family protein